MPTSKAKFGAKCDEIDRVYRVDYTGSWTAARMQGLPRNLGWSLAAPVADRNDAARET